MTDGTSAVALRFEILGPVRAYRDAEPVDLGPLRQRAVLAILLLHAGEPVPVHRIVDALWGGDPPANGTDVVQRYVGALRRALDPERTSLLTLTPGGYLLRAAETAVDAARFRAALARARTAQQTGDLDLATGEAGQALALWQDEPLTGLTGPMFDSARARLNQERATAAELLAPTLPAKPTPPAQPATAAAPPAQPAAAPPAQPEPEPEPVPVSPGYPEPTDPWAGHQLFPPGPF